MTNDNQINNMTEPQPITFGNRLKSAREALGLESKDIAAQLRLNEKMIQMMETEKYPSDLPLTFIQGYLRCYAKFLNIPEMEVKTAIDIIVPKPAPQEIVVTKSAMPVTSGHYFMQFFTYLIIITIIGLVGAWWYSHSSSSSSTVVENQLAMLPEKPDALTNNLGQPSITDSKSLGSQSINQAIKVVTAPVAQNVLAMNVTKRKIIGYKPTIQAPVEEESDFDSNAATSDKAAEIY